MRDPHNLSESETYDDLDRLFLTRLDRVPVPESLTAQVLARTVARRETTRTVLAWPWLAAGLVALGLLVIAGYGLGASLATSDGLELIQATLDDVGLLATAPGDVLAALGEVIPWQLLVLAGSSAGLLILAAGHVVARVPASLRARSAA